MDLPAELGNFPARVGRYELLLPIASGGMATVYLARTRGIGGFERDVALKLVHQHLRSIPSLTRDLIEEAKLAARLKHPNVVPVLDVGEDPNGVYLVMEYIEGTSLSGLFRASASQSQKLPMGVGLRLFVDALCGLEAAHALTDAGGERLELVHRDFSPQNILVGIDGLGRLTDFGIARAASRMSETRSGVTKGKLAYMSPEQARAEPLDQRSDVWSAGIVAWEVVARRRLFKGNEASLILDLVTKDAPSLRTLRPDVPAALDKAIAWALQRNPGRRCPSAQELRNRLQESCTGAYALASSDEVAAYVKQLLAPALKRRREQVEEVARLRAQMSVVVSNLAVPTQLSSDGLSDSPLSPPSPEREDATQSINPERPEASRATVQSLEESRGESRRGMLWAAALVLLAALVGAVVVTRAGSGPSPDPANSVASAPAPPAVSSVVAPSPPTSALANMAVEVVSNAPLAKLEVDGRPVRLERGARRVELSLPRSAARIAGIAVDGRRASAVLSQEGGRIELQFAKAPRRVPGKRRDPLIDNPY